MGYRLSFKHCNNIIVGRYESSSEASNANNPVKRPNFEAPAPAKGILKKSNSNPQLTKIEQVRTIDIRFGRVLLLIILSLDLRSAVTLFYDQRHETTQQDNKTNYCKNKVIIFRSVVSW